MSLTSQLNTSHSDVSKFFADNESKSGMVECLKLLQSTTPLSRMAFKPEKMINTTTYLGVMADYLFRFYYLGNDFQIEKTIAYKCIDICNKYISFHPDNKCIVKPIGSIITAKLLQTGTPFFNRTLLDDRHGLYRATTFAVLDAFFRSERWPSIIIENICEYLISIGWWKKFEFEGEYVYEESRSVEFSKNEVERIAIQSFDEFYDTLGGDDFTFELINIVNIMKESKKINNGLGEAQIKISNETMYNSRFIGADFDAVMIKGNDMIMTDIKTLTRPLTKKDLLQLISYCLLWSKKDEPPRITHAGIYHGRSGDYKYLPLPDIIRMTLPTFESIEDARSEFISRIAPHEEKTSTKPTVSAARSLANAQRKAAIAFSSRKL